MTDKAKETSTAAAATGLRGVVVGASTVSDVVGDKGELIYQGYNIHDLAKHSTFEEVAFLLWNKRLPTQAELDELNSLLADSYAVPKEVFDVMRHLPRDADPIDVLRTAVSALESYDATARDLSVGNSRKVAIKLTAQFATLVAASERIRNGKDPIDPLPNANIATNFLYMLKGEKPSDKKEDKEKKPEGAGSAAEDQQQAEEAHGIAACLVFALSPLRERVAGASPAG